jgi:hypothetical protein
MVYLPNWTSSCVGGVLAVYQAANGNGDWLFGAAASVPGETGGMDFYASLSALNPFPISLWNTNLGSLSLFQLVDPARDFMDSFYLMWRDAEFGKEGLDTAPYAWVSSSASASLEAFMTRDSPYMDLTYSGAQFADMNDSFDDYLMYTPPPCGNNFVQCVPVGHFYWGTTGYASIPGNQNWADYAGPAGTVSPGGSKFTASSTFPSWIQVNSGGDTFVQQ